MTDSSPNSVSVLINSAPSPDLEAIELPLALAAFDLPVALIFSGQGIFWLIGEQSARKPKGKSPSRLISALPMYDCEQVFCVQQDLSFWGTGADQLPDFVKVVDQAELPALLNTRHCFRF